jgi:hypothetical protein
MATSLNDINFQSEVFADALEMEFTHRVGLLSSGLLVPASDALIPANQGGQFASVAQVKSIAGPSVQITSGGETVFKEVGDFKDIAVWIEREDAWDAETILNLIAKRDPTRSVVNALATYWAREIHTSAVKVLTGAFTTALLSSHSTGNTYTAGIISPESLLAGKQLLGDNKDFLSTIVMNSKVHTDAVSQNLQVTTQRSDQAFATGLIPMILGMVPTISDLLEAVSSVYSTYLAMRGAMIYKTRPRPMNQFNNANIVRAGNIEIELYRNAIVSGGIDGIITRMSYLVHLPGVKWGVSTVNPTNTQLATGSNWTKVADDDKLIRIAEVKTL